jgi:SAM-dependent methyltransferase
VNRRDWLASGLALLASAGSSRADEPAEVEAEEEGDSTPPGEPFSLFVPTPERAVIRMLELARVTPRDLVLDLGSGDGRIPIVAARRFGARGRGVDINAGLVQESNAEARRQGVAARVRFERADVMDTDASAATVVTLYLFPALINRLKPRLFAQLKPGARIVIYDYTMSEWPAEETLAMYVPERYLGRGGDVSIRLWVVPANFSGRWAAVIDGLSAAPLALFIDQRYQRIEGTAQLRDAKLDFYNTHVQGPRIEFGIEDSERTRCELVGRLDGDMLRGEARIQRGSESTRTSWLARRTSPPASIERPVT